MCTDSQNSEVEITPSDISKRCCLNCGTELNGEYCHKCGQHASTSKLTIKSFIREYIDNAFLWDSHFLKTIWLMITRPGFLTKEFLSGKFVSQENPLKLNMFLLFVFITLCIFFKSSEKLNNTVHGFITDERVVSAMQMSKLLQEELNIEDVNASPRDTVLLYMPLELAEDTSNYIKIINIIEDNPDALKDRFVAVVPRLFIEEGILVADEDEYYHIVDAPDTIMENIHMVYDVWVKMVDITTQYLPILLLLTAPLLSFSLHLVWRKEKLPNINHFIFSLHYTAFIELLIIFIYLMYLVFKPPYDLLEGLFFVASCVYLAIAFREVYATTSWLKTVTKAFVTSMIYFSILFFIFLGIIIVACFLVADQYL